MGYRSDLLISLGKTIAQITADFAPVPGLCPAVDLLCGLIQLCDNITLNRNAARQLGDRCHEMLIAFREDMKNAPGSMTEAIYAVEDTLTNIQTRMKSCALLSRTHAFLHQKEVSREIEKCHSIISDCMTRFQLSSHVGIHRWQEDFESSRKADQRELVEYLAEIKNTQEMTNVAMTENTEAVRNLMLISPPTVSITGLSSNLWQLQQESGQLLPSFHLKSGEVTRIGQFPVSGTAAMDIYEGLYLQREKVAIKVVRSINANDKSLRRFMREVGIWSDIWNVDKGRYILPFYGFCQEDGPFPYMVSPWQENGTALQYVKTKDLEASSYQRLIKGIACGIKVLHTMNPPVIHGDIKAANIAINSRGDPLLADFGLSQIVEDITGIPFTQSRGVADSYRWFAPEVCVGQGVLSTYSDIYAYGMTVLELLTHQQPYREIKHTTEVVIKSSKGAHPLRPMEREVVARGLKDRLWGLLISCWAETPRHRPSIQSILEYF
ncbi:kinase-like domain-containing protein [Desarmillaria tabescens]|uniref:Kinase-like domain-containing protein n=1 Tax=Armillaria tabescens TaxID=1929756 RepID=A0AA39NLN9_ARMTA|nr:kinase-like domain-containing protein [Desarmillaria tabescens]KAK0467943.1 kinase-like domain-containing protein [Desarmillaria tabescens]